MLSANVAHSLRYAQVAAFALLALATFVRWLRQRDPAGAWLIVTFSVLTLLGVGSLFMPADDTHANTRFMQSYVCLAVLFPYFLYRFMVAFERTRRWEEISVHAMVLPTAIMTFAVDDFTGPPSGQPQWFGFYVFQILITWLGLISLVVVRLWRAGRGLPAVAKRRAQLLAAGSALLAFGMVVLTLIERDRHQWIVAGIELLAILAAVLFLLGFAPPASLIHRWRHREEVAFRAALGDVAISQSAGPELLTELLQRLCNILGAARADWLDADGVLAGSWGTEGRHSRPVHVRFAPGREMVVWVTRYTPFFRPEVHDGVSSLAQMLNLTIERADANQREVQLRADLLDSQRIARLGSWRWNLASRALTWSDEMYRIHGVDPGAHVEAFDFYRALMHPTDRENADRQYNRSIERLEPFDAQYRIVRPDGETRWMHSLGSVVADAEGRPAHIVGTCQDITERRQLELQLTHQATHDELTGLPNRTMLMSRLRELLGAPQEPGRTTALLFLDIDRFKIINDSLGHEAGDELLVALARRIRSVLRPDDVVARFGGDELVVLCASVRGSHEAFEVARRIQEMVRQPVQWRESDLVVSISVGIAMASVTGPDASELIRDADAAMYRAKQQGRDSVVLFADSMRADAVTRLTTENDLRRALAANELRMSYQPVVSLDTGALAGFEALVRWQHPTRGLLRPVDFLAIAEDTGMIVPIGEWVLEQACRQLVRWSRQFPHRAGIWMAVNLSARQVSQPDFADHAAAILRRTRVDPGLIELEITESLLMLDTRESTRILTSLSHLGMRLCVDDFGTGYSSLSYLKRFPVHKLKIDQSFVQGLASDRDDLAIVEAILALANALGLTAVAEGIENAAQLRVLHSLGCPAGQGHHFSEALPAEAFAQMLAGDAAADLLAGSIV